jgi:RNAse (barnase) inhibitor barstar
VAFYNKAMPSIKPVYKNLVLQTATQMKGRRMNQDSLTRAFTSNKTLKGLNGMDIDALVTLVMQEVSNDTQSDLRNMMANMKSNTQQKQAQRSMLTSMHIQQSKKDSLDKAANNNKQGKSKDQKDNLGDMSQEQQLQLQMMMDKKNKLEEMISNMMKKISDTQNQIISNLK